MDASNLMPGYVHQGFAKAHQRVAVGCGNGEQIIGKWAKIPAVIIDHSLYWVECPIRTIEEVALTAINIVGSTFSKGCRKNLKLCSMLLIKDITDVVSAGLIIYFPLLLTSYLILEIANALLQPFKESSEKFVNTLNSLLNTNFFSRAKKAIFYDYQVQYKKNEMIFYGISATRKYGLNNMFKLHDILFHSNPEVSNRFSYKRLLSVNTIDFENFLKNAAPGIKEIKSKKLLLKSLSKGSETEKKELQSAIADLQKKAENLLFN